MIWTQAIRRGLARSIIPKLFNKGFSASAALKYFKKIGPGLRRSLWLADWREITGAKKLERVYRFIPRKLRLSKGLMAPSNTFQRMKYKYVYDTEVEDMDTKERSVRTQSMESDVNLSIEEAEREWLEKMQDEENPYNWQQNVTAVGTILRVVYRRHPVSAVLAEPSWIEPGQLGPEWV